MYIYIYIYIYIHITRLPRDLRGVGLLLPLQPLDALVRHARRAGLGLIIIHIIIIILFHTISYYYDIIV